MARPIHTLRYERLVPDDAPVAYRPGFEPTQLLEERPRPVNGRFLSLLMAVLTAAWILVLTVVGSLLGWW